MKPEQIHDALNYLDDRLIEETEKLRQKKRPSPWKKWTALAACLCLVIAGSFAVLALTQRDQSKNECIIIENEEEFEEAAPEGAEELQVRILSWQENGFTAEIVSEGGTGLKAGERVEVRLMHMGDLPEKFPKGSLVIPGLIEPETSDAKTESEELTVLYAEGLQPG